MKILIISDQDHRTKSYESIIKSLHNFFDAQNFELEEICIGSDLAFCKGCFGCWVKSPGECVINDNIGMLNKKQMNSDAVIFLTPVIFGQFSANIKNVIDRWLPNALPFFEVRPNGSTMHPPRYIDYPKQIMIGYTDAISKKDEQLFTDINNNHRSNIDVLFWHDDIAEFNCLLEKISFKRIGGSL